MDSWTVLIPHSPPRYSGGDKHLAWVTYYQTVGKSKTGNNPESGASVVLLHGNRLVANHVGLFLFSETLED